MDDVPADGLEVGLNGRTVILVALYSESLDKLRGNRVQGRGSDSIAVTLTAYWKDSVIPTESRCTL